MLFVNNLSSLIFEFKGVSDEPRPAGDPDCKTRRQCSAIRAEISHRPTNRDPLCGFALMCGPSLTRTHRRGPIIDLPKPV